jgi:hypothetical protein
MVLVFVCSIKFTVVVAGMLYRLWSYSEI